jgi:hypothetical protein
MGLNSSGQLGLGNTSNVYTPTLLPLENCVPVAVVTGPLAFHSFVLSKGVPFKRPALPSIDLVTLQSAVDKMKLAATRYGSAASDTANALRSLRQSIADAFSSLSVLNASFHVDYSTNGHPQEKGALCIDLQAVRHSYDLIFSTENEQVVATLGRATLQLADHLRECPFDDPENLSVFLIVLENPLMLKPHSFHVAIERFLGGMLALPNAYQVILFGWYRSYSSEYFSRALQVLQEYLTFAVTQRAVGINPVHSVLVMKNLHDVNRKERILPELNFYNASLPRAVDMAAEWDRFRTYEKSTQVFNYFSYPFLVDIHTKSLLLQREFAERKSAQQRLHFQQYSTARSLTPLLATFPTGVRVAKSSDGTHAYNATSLFLCIDVRREMLLLDLLVQLSRIVLSNELSLRLPIKVSFIGEEGVDQGGVYLLVIHLSIINMPLSTLPVRRNRQGALHTRHQTVDQGVRHTETLL